MHHLKHFVVYCPNCGTFGHNAEKPPRGCPVCGDVQAFSLKSFSGECPHRGLRAFTSDGTTDAAQRHYQ